MIYFSATIIHQLRITGDISQGGLLPYISDNIPLNIWLLKYITLMTGKMQPQKCEIRCISSIATARANVWHVQWKYI